MGRTGLHSEEWIGRDGMGWDGMGFFVFFPRPHGREERREGFGVTMDEEIPPNRFEMR
jgi:hypothetical protein